MSAIEPQQQHDAWPLSLNLPLLDEDQQAFELVIASGMTTLVGPNGSGKTRTLRAIKAAIDATQTISKLNLKTRFLSAGRSIPLKSIGPT